MIRLALLSAIGLIYLLHSRDDCVQLSHPHTLYLHFTISSLLNTLICYHFPSFMYTFSLSFLPCSQGTFRMSSGHVTICVTSRLLCFHGLLEHGVPVLCFLEFLPLPFITCNWCGWKNGLRADSSWTYSFFFFFSRSGLPFRVFNLTCLVSVFSITSLMHSANHLPRLFFAENK